MIKLLSAPQGSRFGALFLSGSSSPAPMNTATTRRRAGAVAGSGRRGTADAGSWRLSCVGFRGEARSRSPHRDRPLPVVRRLARRVCPHGVVLVRVETSSWTLRPERSRRTQPPGGQTVFPMVIDPLRVSPGGRDIGVDSLAT
ncbi:MAG: hypothetical protein JO364_17260 [Pseudonocardiales bacterium]|nr:hypothetical protein [Pseudonocardiales bacterium]